MVGGQGTRQHDGRAGDRAAWWAGRKQDSMVGGQHIVVGKTGGDHCEPQGPEGAWGTTSPSSPLTAASSWLTFPILLPI